MTTAFDRPERREISSTIGESSLTLGLEMDSWIKLLRCDPGADPEFVTNTDGPASGGGPLLQSNERQKAVDPNPELAQGPELTSRELRWLRLEGQVDMRGLVLRAGVGVEESVVAEAVERATKSFPKAPQLPFL